MFCIVVIIILFSPSGHVVIQAAKIQDVVVDPITSVIYHLEGRPQEAGRSVLVNTEKGKDVVGEGWNFRTGVQEVRSPTYMLWYLY